MSDFDTSQVSTLEPVLLKAALEVGLGVGEHDDSARVSSSLSGAEGPQPPNEARIPPWRMRHGRGSLDNLDDGRRPSGIEAKREYFLGSAMPWRHHGTVQQQGAVPGAQRAVTAIQSQRRPFIRKLV